jgi:hypothetical protein
MFTQVSLFHPHRSLPSASFASDFPSKILYNFIFPLHHTNLIFLDTFTLIIFGDEFKLWSPTLCNFLYRVVTSSPIQIFSSAHCSQAPLLYFLSLQWKADFYSHTEQEVTFIAAQSAALLFHMLRCWVQILANRPVILNEFLHGFLQSLQINAGLVLKHRPLNLIKISIV